MLQMPTYGLNESGRLLYLTSSWALTYQSGFTNSKLDLFMYFYDNCQDAMLLVVQVDDYLCTGSPRFGKAIESFIHEQFQIGSTKRGAFNITGANFTQDETGTIRIEEKE